MVIHLFAGQNDISFSEVWNGIFNFDETNMNQIIGREIRIPRMTTALLAGGALSLAGLLMQTLFKNPLAGPYVLGINSGATLLVGLSILSGVSFFSTDYGIVINALIGAFLFGLIILSFSKFVKNQLSLLLIGIMLGSFTSAFISILQSLSNANELKLFTLWGLGSLQKVTFEQIPMLLVILFVGLLLTLVLAKKLNLLILGESEAKLMGVNVKMTRYVIIGITALFTGVITAFCGPIAFIGLAVPNITRIIFKTQNHHILIITSFIIGAMFLLACDIIIQLLEHQIVIPINALTSIIGAPLVVLIVFRKLK
jgi:iron complex transport system permease protein